MSKRYAIHCTQHMPGPPFNTKAEARTALRQCLADGLQRARLVNKQATKHKLGTDTYSITMGRDQRSSLWQTYALVEY